MSNVPGDIAFAAYKEMPDKFSVHVQTGQLADIMGLQHLGFLQPDMRNGNSLCACFKSCGLVLSY